MNSGLDNSVGCFCQSSEVFCRNSTSAEDVSIGKVLGGQVSNRKLRENNLSARLSNSLEFVVDDGPFGINQLLIVFHIFDSNLSILFLRFELKLEVEKTDLRVIKLLWLLLEPSIREGLLERPSINEERFSNTSSSDLFNSDQVLVQILIKSCDRSNYHVGEELSLCVDQFGVERGHGALLEKVLPLFLFLLVNLDGDLTDP